MLIFCSVLDNSVVCCLNFWLISYLLLNNSSWFPYVSLIFLIILVGILSMRTIYFPFLRNHSDATTMVRLWYFSAAFAHPFLALLLALLYMHLSAHASWLCCFCPPNQLSSLRVEMLNESLSNTCLQLDLIEHLKYLFPGEGKERIVLQKQSEHVEDILVLLDVG